MRRHPALTDAENTLKEGLRLLHISSSPEIVESFMRYLAELRKWNRAYNLTSLHTDREIVVKHFLDSLLYLQVISDRDLRIIDVGSGAGFPGIPMKIVRSRLDMTLLDPSRKKASFLRHIIRTLSLSSIRVREQRMETMERGDERLYDVALSRATFSAVQFLRIACPWVKKGGTLVLSKGPNYLEELRELRAVPGLESAVHEVVPCDLPLSRAKRYIIVLSCQRNS